MFNHWLQLYYATLLKNRMYNPAFHHMLGAGGGQMPPHNAATMSRGGMNDMSASHPMTPDQPYIINEHASASLAQLAAAPQTPPINLSMSDNTMHEPGEVDDSEESSPSLNNQYRRSRSETQTDGRIIQKTILSKTSSTGEHKPWVCHHDNCAKTFANKFLLKKHEFIHTGERPHQCPYCTKKFNRKDNLLRHKKTHLANSVDGKIGAVGGGGNRRRTAAPAAAAGSAPSPCLNGEIAQQQPLLATNGIFANNCSLYFT
jgi:hypothetical protein